MNRDFLFQNEGDEKGNARFQWTEAGYSPMWKQHRKEAREKAIQYSEEHEALGEVRGIIETGFDFGLSEQDILSQLQRKMNISLQKAQEYFQMLGRQTL